jgi:hypothetical protein
VKSGGIREKLSVDGKFLWSNMKYDVLPIRFVFLELLD